MSKPVLLEVSVPGKSRVTGAINIRAELKYAFPGVKFSVTSEAFSMGTAIDIRWSDGPTVQEVREITEKYEYGTFNAMDDSSGFKNREFTKLYGGAKFVQCQRRETKQEVAQ